MSPAILALKKSATTALKLAGAAVKAEESCTVRLAKQRTGRERCEGCERCRANELGLTCQALRTGVSQEDIQPCPGL